MATGSEGMVAVVERDVKNARRILKAGSALVVVLMNLAVLRAAFGKELGWLSGPYTYVVVNQDVRQVLIEFGQNLNIPVKISDHVQRRNLRGPLNVMAAGEFLKTVCESAGLVWYFDGTVLHVSSAAEISRASIDAGFVASPSLKRQLENLGVLDDRYPLRIDAASGVISVAGPPPYIDAVKRSIQVIAKGTPRVQGVIEAKRVRVFRAGQEGT
jgi:type II secretory pathway component GspD/PulD (secretin)